MASSEPWEQAYFDISMAAWLKLKLQEFVPIKDIILNFYTSFPQYAGPELTEEKLEDFGVRNLGMKWWKKYFRKLDEQQMEEKIEKAVQERVQDITLVQEIPKQEPELSSEPEPKIEEKVEEVVKEVPPVEEFLPKDEKEKIGDLKHHRMILKEIWENYLKCKGSERAESTKSKYLEQLSKELIIVRDLEQTEKGAQSLLEEVRLAEEGETVEQFRDYLEGYTLQVLCRKAGTPEQAVQQLTILEGSVKVLKTLLETNTLENAIKIYLEKLYQGEGNT